jgi:transposase
MLRVDYDRWGQRPDELRGLAVSSSHERTRERFLALYSSGTSATGVAARIGRHPQSVMQWVHAYNSNGPGAVVYRRTGGRPPFARRSRPPSAA